MYPQSTLDLPEEIWTHIFDLAADEDLIFQYGLPTSMAEAAWFKSIVSEWALRTPQEALNLIQRRSYATKKAIIMTCKQWRRLGSEFLFRTLFFNNPSKLLLLSRSLNSSTAAASTVSSTLGWWTRRIHLTRYYVAANPGIPMVELENALVSIIQHCPNLEIFIIEWPMGSTFGPVADALATYTRRSLRTVHWCIPRSAIPKVIWALDSLPYILAAYIDVDPASHEGVDCDDLDSNDSLPLGAAADVQLTLRCLQQLSLRGQFHELLEEAVGWHMPSLRNVTLDSVNSSDQPDAISFLAKHGSKLVYLDLDCVTSHNVPVILDMCQDLNTFAFNVDWPLSVPGEDGNLPGSVMKDLDLPKATLVNRLVRRPHAKITTIGLHGLMHAFGMDFMGDSWRSWGGPSIRRSNDLNVNALDKITFPNLKRVRALSRPLLTALNKANGPSQQGGGMERWENWWQHFTNMNIRLEDCTGELLGVLPGGDEGGDEEEDDQEDDDDEEEEEEEEDNQWGYQIPPMEPEGGGGSHITELRQLLAECRAMSEDREEPMFSMFGMMGMGGGGMGFGGMGYGSTGRDYGANMNFYGGPGGGGVRSARTGSR
ncbi:hypothetical protein M378DRAFT_77851 [Amanita muscaria Koide BX008]|uniref:Uncharacterized protein n=1 Tax=Amanita muscaria (strain Koide BX008) TaxID=946122 RepID=A0A0C2SN77_AMAMK|nr:hypothetical protein M378DRAFT_77851 [Amanita muscaria Koide BX008]